MGIWPPQRSLLFAASMGLVAVACAVGAAEDPEEGDPVPDAGTVEAGKLPGKSAGDDDDAGRAKDGGPTKDAGVDGATPNGNAACLAALAAASFDFSADQGWTHRVSDNAAGEASWPFDPWTRGTSTTIPCPDGSCWGAELTENYAQCQRGELLSPKIDLKACAGQNIALTFKHAYAFWTGSYGSQTWFDGGIVEISNDNGVTWSVPSATYPGTVKINPNRGGSYSCVLEDDFHVHGKSGFVGSQTTASTVEIVLPASAINDKLRVRFAQASGVSSSTSTASSSRSATAAGWRIDDVKFIAK